MPLIQIHINNKYPFHSWLLKYPICPLLLLKFSSQSSPSKSQWWRNPEPTRLNESSPLLKVQKLNPMERKFSTSVPIITSDFPTIPDLSKLLKRPSTVMVSVWVQSDSFAVLKIFTNNWKKWLLITTILKTRFSFQVDSMPMLVSLKPFTLLKISSSVTLLTMLPSSTVWDSAKPKRQDTIILMSKTWNKSWRKIKMQEWNWSLLMESSPWTEILLLWIKFIKSPKSIKLKSTLMSAMLPGS